MKIRSMLASVGLCAATFAVAAPPANAGWACNNLGMCGKIYHRSDSNRSSMSVSKNWGATDKAPVNVPRGSWSTSYVKDADGFRIPSGCYGQKWAYSNKEGYWYKASTVGAGWHKVTDGSKTYMAIEGC